MPRTYYDDNYGTWSMDHEDQRDFYRHVQRTNVWKVCSICGRKVKIQPQYDKCNSCCEQIERGQAY